jgi:hypothetical protein
MIMTFNIMMGSFLLVNKMYIHLECAVKDKGLEMNGHKTKVMT